MRLLGREIGGVLGRSAPSPLWRTLYPGPLPPPHVGVERHIARGGGSLVAACHLCAYMLLTTSPSPPYPIRYGKGTLSHYLIPAQSWGVLGGLGPLPRPYCAISARLQSVESRRTTDTRAPPAPPARGQRLLAAAPTSYPSGAPHRFATHLWTASPELRY